MEFMPEGPMAIPLWVNGHAFLTASQAFFDVVNPVTGEAQRRVPLCGEAEAVEVVAAARAAQPDWAASPLGERQACLSRLADALDRYTGHFAKLLVQDTGRDDADATAEVDAAVAALRAGLLEAGEGMAAGGVSGIVLDANRPLAGFAAQVAAVVQGGATLVVKPSPKAPSAIFALCELSGRAEWPAGVLNLLQGDLAALRGLAASGIDRLIYVGGPELAGPVSEIAAAAGLPCEQA